jgi:hypothetical protein
MSHEAKTLLAWAQYSQCDRTAAKAALMWAQIILSNAY